LIRKKFYTFFFRQFRSFTDSKAYCEGKGLELAFPESKEENAQMLLDIQNSYTTHPNARKFAHENYVSILPWSWAAQSWAASPSPVTYPEAWVSWPHSYNPSFSFGSQQ